MFTMIVALTSVITNHTMNNEPSIVHEKHFYCRQWIHRLFLRNTPNVTKLLPLYHDSFQMHTYAWYAYRAHAQKLAIKALHKQNGSICKVWCPKQRNINTGQNLFPAFILSASLVPCAHLISHDRLWYRTIKTCDKSIMRIIILWNML